MAFSNTSPYILMLMISSTFVLFALAFDVSNDVAEGPAPGSGDDGFFPLARKHVTIRNVVANRKLLYAHCKSSETDFGITHIPWGGSWDFRFRVNFSKSTKFRCLFFWSGGGYHHFTVFKVSRDDDPFGTYPVCKECIWEVGRYKVSPMCRVNRDKTEPYCFPWED